MKIKKGKNMRKKKRKVKKATQVFKDEPNLILLRLVDFIYLFNRTNSIAGEIAEYSHYF